MPVFTHTLALTYVCIYKCLYLNTLKCILLYVYTRFSKLPSWRQWAHTDFDERLQVALLDRTLNEDLSRLAVQQELELAAQPVACRTVYTDTYTIRFLESLRYNQNDDLQKRSFHWNLPHKTRVEMNLCRRWLWALMWFLFPPSSR